LPKRAVLFDLDNTLHDRDAGVAAFLRTQHSERRLDPLGITLDRWTSRFVSLDRGGRVWKDEVYRRLCAEFPMTASPAELLEEYELGFARHVVPVDALIETLIALRESGCATGVITNGRSSFQRRTIAGLGIEPLLDVVVISEECGFRKPDPAIFQRALSTLECEPSSAWFVGDDPVADIEGARGAGLAAIHFKAARGGDIASLAGLLAYL